MTDQSNLSGATRAQFRLNGPSRSFDPIRQAIRPDLADAAEAGHHFAPHYAEPAAWVFTRNSRLTASTDPDAAVLAEADAGAAFALLDLTGDWAWGYLVDGHIVGYVRAEDVAPQPAS